MDTPRVSVMDRAASDVRLGVKPGVEDGDAVLLVDVGLAAFADLNVRHFEIAAINAWLSPMHQLSPKGFTRVRNVSLYSNVASQKTNLPCNYSAVDNSLQMFITSSCLRIQIPRWSIAYCEHLCL